MGTAILRTLAAALLAGAALAGCGDSAPPANTGCSPACNVGYACVASACVPSCSAACAPNQSCVVRGGAAMCEGPGDAATDVSTDVSTDAPLPPADQEPPDTPAIDAPADVATDAPATDAPATDAPTPDAAMDAALDAPMDAAPIDRPAPDVTPPMDTAAVDAARTDTSPTDASPIDASPIDTSPTDTSPTDASRADAAPDAAPAPCGTLGLACCSGRVCVGGTVCDVAAMRCVGFTPATDECTTTVRCSGTRVCGGVYFCDTRACLLCVPPGVRPLGAACSRLDECASGFCANGVCTATCAFGSGGDAQCRATDARAICAQFTSRPAAADGGLGNTISTFGGCVTGCTRNGDCASGLVCRLQRNDLNDRLDNVCGNPTGAIAPGMPCDPSPPAGSTAAAFCNNSQCVATGTHTGYCSAFCATDADCPSTAYACIGFTFGRPSGAPQSIRMCALR